MFSFSAADMNNAALNVRSRSRSCRPLQLACRTLP